MCSDFSDYRFSDPEYIGYFSAARDILRKCAGPAQPLGKVYGWGRAFPENIRPSHENAYAEQQLQTLTQLMNVAIELARQESSTFDASNVRVVLSRDEISDRYYLHILSELPMVRFPEETINRELHKLHGIMTKDGWTSLRFEDTGEEAVVSDMPRLFPQNPHPRLGDTTTLLEDLASIMILSRQPHAEAYRTSDTPPYQTVVLRNDFDKFQVTERSAWLRELN